MINYLPEFYPEELIYSWCARYHQRMGYRSREATGRDLFGKAAIKVATDLPSNLAALTKASVWNTWKTVDELIDKHSLLPFYAPFVPSFRVAQIRTDMANDRGGSIHARLGILTQRVRNQTLRFCQMCVISDRTKFGETYWHRVHQAPGVVVCPTHQIFLDESAVKPYMNGPLCKELLTADTQVTDLPVRSIRKDNRDHNTYLELATNSQWLLDHPHIGHKGNDENRERYVGLLYARRFSRYSGRVRLTALGAAIRQHYSRDLLEYFHCGFDKTTNWVIRLMHETKKAQPPVEHLLLIHFLGLSIKDFFKTPTRRQPFGEGPWPCLNPACENFRRPIITTCQQVPRKGFGEPKGIFRCACGLAYYRIGADNCPNDRFHANGFDSVTESWKITLTDLAVENPTVKSLAAHFCTSPQIIRQHLLDLGFEYESRTIRGISYSVMIFPGADRQQEKLKLRKSKRTEWLSLQENNSEMPRNGFCRKYIELYGWLARHDKQWLDTHLPPRKSRGGPGYRYDWHKVDKELAKRVRHEANRIRSSPGKLVRVSPSLVAGNLGKLALVNKRGYLLPLTCQALSEVCESIEDFAIRRIRWKAASFKSQGVSFNRWQLQLRAGLSSGVVARYPLIRATLEEAVTAASM